jgi:soluble lytic murein transglycosylase-like protein
MKLLVSRQRSAKYSSKTVVKITVAAASFLFLLTNGLEAFAQNKIVIAKVALPASAITQSTETEKQTTARSSSIETPKTETGAKLKTKQPALIAPPVYAAASRRQLGFSTGSDHIDGYILESTSRHKIDPLLVYAQMSQESSFKIKATSYKGARGLMQLMPATAVRFGVTNIYDPKQNIEGGVKYMRWLLDTFDGDVRLALAGYNAGEGAVMKYGNTIPPYRETQDYVARITARYANLKNPALLAAANKPAAGSPTTAPEPDERLRPESEQQQQEQPVSASENEPSRPISRRVLSASLLVPPKQNK